MFLCLIKFISKYSEGQGQPWPGPHIGGPGPANQARASPDRPMDSLAIRSTGADIEMKRRVRASGNRQASLFRVKLSDEITCVQTYSRLEED